MQLLLTIYIKHNVQYNASIIFRNKQPKIYDIITKLDIIFVMYSSDDHWME